MGDLPLIRPNRYFWRSLSRRKKAAMTEMSTKQIYLELQDRSVNEQEDIFLAALKFIYFICSGNEA